MTHALTILILFIAGIALCVVPGGPALLARVTQAPGWRPQDWSPQGWACQAFDRAMR